MRVIMYAFWGRKANVELQMPYIHRILQEHPEVEFHGWDLARDPKDSAYLRTLKGERITIQTAFYGPVASKGQERVWKHYARPEYQDAVFVKIDDDVVFIETASFGGFVQSAVDNPQHVISALTINNGASTSLLPKVWDMFETLDIPLLDVHLSAEYAENSHRWFFDNWRHLIDQPNTLTPVQTWVSINCIAYRWNLGRQIAALLGTRPPIMIADREYPRRNPDGRIVRHRVGDEGAVNMFPRYIHQGFVVGHLYFGPQARHMDDALLTELRKHYADVATQYLQ